MESFNVRLRDKPPNGTPINSLRAAEIIPERWQQHTSIFQPHTWLGYRPLMHKALEPASAA